MVIPQEFKLKDQKTLDIFRYFAYEHLHEPMKGISKYFYDMAVYLIRTLPENQQLQFGLLQLLQAKDAFVRSSLDLPQYPTEEYKEEDDGQHSEE